MDVEQLEELSMKRLFNRQYLLDVLDVIKCFIVARKLVIYGGQAIDFALRAKNSKLYSNLEIPDYDFYSSDSVQDAYDLVDILKEKGYEQVSAIKAKHPQTMRVRVGSNTVADISYLPPDVFNRVQKGAIKYQCFLVRNPYEQMVDILRALTYPLDGFPQSAYKARSKKDLTRLDLLIEKYPLTQKTLNISTKKLTNLSNVELTITNPKRQVLYGTAAYCAFYTDYADLGLQTSEIVELPVSPTNNGTFKMKYKDWREPSLLIFDRKDINNGDALSKDWYKSYTDIIPPSNVSKDGVQYYVELFLFMLVSQWKGLYVVSLQGLLSYLLHFNINFNDQNAGLLALSLLKMVENVKKVDKSKLHGTLFSPAGTLIGCQNRPLDTGFFPQIRTILPSDYHDERPKKYEYSDIFTNNGKKTSEDNIFELSI